MGVHVPGIRLAQRWTLLFECRIIAAFCGNDAMPTKRISMRKIKEILRLEAAGLSVRQMAASLHLSVGAIAKYLKAAEGAGLSWPLPDSLDETQLEAMLFPVAPAPSRFAQPDFRYVHQELKRK